MTPPPPLQNCCPPTLQTHTQVINIQPLKRWSLLPTWPTIGMVILMAFVHLFSVPTWASFCLSTSSCCSVLESILCELCRWALLLSLPIRNLRINKLYSKMITRQVYMLQCKCTVNSVKIIWFLWAQAGWLKNRSPVSVLHRCMKCPVSLLYSCTSIILSRP